MEAGAGIEPANVGFANRCLPTWPSRLFILLSFALGEMNSLRGGT